MKEKTCHVATVTSVDEFHLGYLFHWISQAVTEFRK